ncbi:MAG: murein L,D-transpeptidase catalytic domain family protein [Lentimicrobium sp.]|nr:murein L,D-transpeptidase catalytic domain family protein [Lentimicrobium sp.]
MIPVLNRAGSEITYQVTDLKSDIYSELDLSAYGLSYEVFELALNGHRKLEVAGKLENPGVITIVDFSQSSKKRRMYVIDLLECKLLFNTLVAHGRNTGEEYAKSFSNELGTLKSSLGFYVTKNHIMGSTVGLSLVIQGVEKGFNDNAINRQIIMHGAEYATEDFIKRTGRLGRSYGCPSLPPDLIQPVIETIENGSCLFIYYPDPNYLRKSALLS